MPLYRIVISTLFGALLLASVPLLANAQRGIQTEKRLITTPPAPVDPAAPGFTAGNIVVCRVGTGSAALSSAATPVFLDEYNPSGTLLSTVAMPTANSGNNLLFTASGTAISECQITRSADGKYIIITGYAATPGTLSVATSVSTSINRMIGRVDKDGVIDTSTTTRAFSGSNIRSAASSDGSSFWAIGGSSGVVHVPLGHQLSSVTTISTTATSNRVLQITTGQLYSSSNSGTFRLSTVGTGTPTSSGQTMVNLPGFPTVGSPYGFYFADLDPSVNGIDTVYVADDGADTAASAGVRKFSLVSGSWVLNGTFPANGATIPATGFFGLTGLISGTTVTLYATQSGSKLVRFVDDAGYNATPVSVPTLIATAPTNTAFRGVAMAPGELVPSAADVKIAGRVTNEAGLGIGRARVWIEGDGVETRSTITNPFGYYSIEGLTAGQAYLLTVEARGYVFEQRFVATADSLSNVDFTGQRRR